MRLLFSQFSLALKQQAFKMLLTIDAMGDEGRWRGASDGGAKESKEEDGMGCLLKQSVDLE